MLVPAKRRHDGSFVGQQFRLGADLLHEDVTRHGLAFVAHSPLGTWWSKGLPEHPVVRPIAAARGVSPHAVALAWVLAQGPHVVPIPGTRSVAHLHELLRAAELELSHEELRAIDRADFPRA